MHHRQHHAVSAHKVVSLVLWMRALETHSLQSGTPALMWLQRCFADASSVTLVTAVKLAIHKVSASAAFLITASSCDHEHRRPSARSYRGAAAVPADDVLVSCSDISSSPT